MTLFLTLVPAFASPQGDPPSSASIATWRCDGRDHSPYNDKATDTEDAGESDWCGSWEGGTWSKVDAAASSAGQILSNFKCPHLCSKCIMSYDDPSYDSIQQGPSQVPGLFCWKFTGLSITARCGACN